MSSIDDVLGGKDAVTLIQAISPTALAVVVDFFAAPAASGNLTGRMRELLLLAMHATPTSLDAQAVERQVRRSLDAGATPADVVDVLLTTVGVANHALYAAMPMFEEELARAGMELEESGSLDERFEFAKQEFLDARGFWNADRERFARLMPAYFHAVCRLSVEPWKNGSLTIKEHELVCIAIDCVVTHGYEPGLRLHIGRAIASGATPGEILEVFQIAGTHGIESLALGLRALTNVAEVRR
ncbi:carboxymuconolactone decarboxylase family protein [Nocardioides pocheonensis]|uniref:Carboxymuconolactone decarboxylase-like domain-containing protein n=1 Tax=Nocardioides pocheonensis TaxID=661485 RepID=A0A3N0GIB0_9ACTN|nr:carboxymuconolactone decarboxylase family protein [Nocardioides pocheonensis]RNM12197.1 hypothetical protein EFL26_20560 [Nocardioides pocheonensis]